MFKLMTLLTTLLLSLNVSMAKADQNITIIAPTSEVADGLDLYAVSELFKDSANLEQFEAELNNPEYGINNLDLDGNGEVDFIRVVEEIYNDSHLIILQAIIWEDEFHDVATIEIETSENNYSMHVQGNEVIYGSNYYIAPSHVHISNWPIMVWISRPVYRPYHSAYYWKSYPRWWQPHRPLLKNNYYARTHKYKKHNTFVVTKVARVNKVARVKYKPRTSGRVTKYVGHKKTIRPVNKNNTRVTKTTTKKVMVKQNTRPTKTSARKEVSRTSTNKNGHKTVVKTTKKTTKSKNVKVKNKKKDEKSDREQRN